MPWQLLLAVAYKESALRIGALNPISNDHGLMQINKITMLTLGLDRHRLVTDERYALTAGCEILKANKHSYQKKVPYWIGLYNAGVLLEKEAVRRNAQAYDRAIRKIAADMGWNEKRAAHR